MCGATLRAAVNTLPIALVTINGRGPFRFVFDTAATSSAVSGQLIAALGLKITQQSVITVNGSLGRGEKYLVHIERLRCGTLLQRDLQLPLLDRYALPVDDGLLGVSGLASKQVEIDVPLRQVSIVDSPGAYRMQSGHAIKLTRHVSGLSLMEASIAGVGCTAILDTGAELSIGNTALLHALRLTLPATAATTLLNDASGNSQRAQLWFVPELRLGGHSLPAGPIAFADTPVFSSLGIMRPALLLGTDRLSTMQRVVIDYSRGRMWLTPG